MGLTQIIWYSLGLGFILFSVVFVISLMASKMKGKKVPYSEKDSLVYLMQNKNLRSSHPVSSRPSKVVYLNKHEDIKSHSLDYVNATSPNYSNPKYQQKYSTGYANTSVKRSASRSRFQVVNDRSYQYNERVAYTRGITAASANFYK